MSTIEKTLDAILAAIGFVLGLIVVSKYKEGREAVDQINREKIQGKQNEMEKSIYKKYDDMSLDDLSKSSGPDTKPRSDS